MSELWPWLAMALLGAYHGLNPAMGWLFAVALGLQDRSRRSLLRALPPIAVGHELSIALVALVVLGVGLLAEAAVLHIGAAVVLVAFGLFRFARPRMHPRWTTMRVSRGELGWWSFLMSSAHGAGLMVAPVLIGGGALEASAHYRTVQGAGRGPMSVPASALAITLHVAAMLVVMALVALLVYEKLGVAVLKRAWINVDHLWAAAFVIAGVLTLLT